MKDNFKCKGEKAGYCNQWLRECVSWSNCHINNYGAPCPFCTAASPLENEQCSDCVHKEWKHENWEE